MSLDSPQDLFRIEGIGHIIYGSAKQCLCLIDRMVYRTDENHRNRSRGWVVLQTRANSIAVHAWRPQVHQHQVGQRVFDELQLQLQLQLPLVHGVAALRQDGHKQLETGGLFVNDENAAFVLALLGRSRGPSYIKTWVTSLPMYESRNGAGLLTAGRRPYDREGLGPRGDCVRRRGICPLVGQVLLAREEAQERTAFLRDVIANRAAQHWIAGLDRVEPRTLRCLTRHVDVHFAVDLRQPSQMRLELDSDHGSVWTSTDRIAGRSRTMGAQLSPASAETYTWPPVVPKYTPHDSSESTAIASRNTLT